MAMVGVDSQPKSVFLIGQLTPEARITTPDVSSLMSVPLEYFCISHYSLQECVKVLKFCCK